MSLRELFNLPKLMTLYEMQDNAYMNSNTDQDMKVSNNEDDKLAMMLKYEEVTPELIPYKMYMRSILMYNNNFKKWMHKLVNIQRDLLVIKKENSRDAIGQESDSPKKNHAHTQDIHYNILQHKNILIDK